MDATSDRNPLGLRLIGGFKLACGLLLVALGVGIFRGANGDLAGEAAGWISKLKVDQDNRYIHSAIEKISNVSPRQLHAIGAGTFLYALLYLVEGVGLLLRKHWAEYLTVVATGLFVPLEVFEVFRKPTAVRIGILAINLAILAYLVYQLRSRREGNEMSSSVKPGIAEG